MSSSNGRRLFVVNHVPLVDRQIKALFGRTTTELAWNELVRMFTQVHAELTVRPTQWGDAVRNAVQPGGVIYRRYQAPFAIHYVVFESRSLVMVLSVEEVM